MDCLGRLAQRKNVHFVKIYSNGPGFDWAHARNFLCVIKYICIDVILGFFKNVTDSRTVYEANTITVFPLSEKVC